MSLFGVQKEFSDVNTPKTSISASFGLGTKHPGLGTNRPMYEMSRVLNVCYSCRK